MEVGADYLDYPVQNQKHKKKIPKAVLTITLITSQNELWNKD